ncbi:MAG: hypothetical protein Athens101410_110 [Parcubacteria group bacterium Athens1014_10]|nr:MAG: hypothetical protein Athens101410_110 [Parcubacteria group bacterium Athens1014_10]TSD05921.1 MAG: hypothetical protein Athens071412_203 [Parcubacteria group bacterium Athens0714_12]
MIEILEKFQRAPKKIKERIEKPEVLEFLEKAEKKYNIDLLRMVIFIATKTIKIKESENFLREYYHLEKKEDIENIKEVLKKVFNPIMDDLEKFSFSDIPSEEKKSSFVPAGALEDEELEKIREKAGKIKPLSVEKLAEEIAGKVNLPFADEILSKRLKSIIALHLRDIRDEIETKEILMKSKKIGGLELSESEAERTAKIFKEEFKKFGEKFKKDAPLPKFEISKPVKPIKFPITKDLEVKIYEAAEAIENSNLPALKPEIKNEEKISFSDLKENKPVEIAEPAKSVAPVLIEPKIPKIITEPKIGKKEIDKQQEKIINTEWKPKIETNKTLMEDIKAPPPKVIGPLEELRYFKLKDFRELADEAQGAALKIKQKIDLLEKESFSKKIQGIRNWRQSEVYRIYLEIGRESIEKNKETKEVIKERIEQGKIALTEEEIIALVDLNKSLRF